MQKSDIDCIFCGISNENVVICENGYTGNQCSGCGLIYISPRPKLEDIVDLYGHDNAHISAADHIDSGFLKRLCAKHHLKIIKSHVSKGTILDVGAGAGNFLDEAKLAGFTPYGIEFNPAQAEHIRSNLKIPCEQGSVKPGIFDDQIFDVVYHCDVISHFYDPISEFKAANEIMKDGSLLVFETGNLGDVDHKHFKKYARFQYPDHLFFFSTKNLEDLLELAGFELLHIHRYSIVSHLLFVRFATKCRGIVSNILPKKAGAIKNSNVSKQSEVNRLSKGAILKSVCMNIYKYVIYLLRYKFGGVIHSPSSPQALVVVAIKRSASVDA